MYIRFAQEARDPVCRVAPGLFHACHRLPPYDGGDWRHRELSRVIHWFGDRLDTPDMLSLPAGRFGPRRGVCWFRDEAAEHVSQARYMAWLMGEIGVPLRELRAHRPGTEIWRDDFQVVVVPERGATIRVQ